MNRWLFATTFLIQVSTAIAAAAGSLPVYRVVAGEEFEYLVESGDTLGAIAGKFGVGVKLTATVNRLPDANRLRLGQPLRLSTRRIVPTKLETGLVVNTGDRMLYWFNQGELVAQYPVGVGRPDWETAPGQYTITGRRRKPTWFVPPSIQKEMLQKGEPVRTKILPGPDNPLGEYWLQLSAGGYGIHGTNAPYSVGKYTTHGCMRLAPAAIERLFTELPKDSPVWIIYEPIKLVDLADGRVLIEAHPDIYGHTEELVTNLGAHLQAAGLADRVDVERARAAVSDAWGVPVDVTRSPSGQQPS